MKLTIRRIGNSLGVIIPRRSLESWGLREGDRLELTESGIQPPASSRGSPHEMLDTLKRNLAVAVAARFTANQIRAHGLANLHRWKRNGAWVSAYAEWQQLLEQGGDGELFAALLGRDEHSNRLRQSPPYIGMLAREDVRRLNEEAAA